VFGAIAYLLLGSGKKQWWADGVESGGNRNTVQASSPSLTSFPNSISSNDQQYCQ